MTDPGSYRMYVKPVSVIVLLHSSGVEMCVGSGLCNFLSKVFLDWRYSGRSVHCKLTSSEERIEENYYHHHHHHHPCYDIYARYLQLCTWNKPRFCAIKCCSCSVFTVCSTCNVISHVKHVLYIYISTSHSQCAVHNMAAVCSSAISRFPVC